MSTVSSTEVNAAATAASYETAETQKKSKVSGKTIGKPELSEKAAKYYEELKKKYSNMDFILVSKDMKEQAKAQAGSYANANSMVVLIDEDKIERMAEDKEYREKYEAIIKNAASNLSQLKDSLGGTGVKGYGMQINDNGTASYFAVIDKSLAAQKERIEKKAAEKKEAKKADEKKKAKEAQEQRVKDKRAEAKEKKVEAEDSVTVTATSVEELIRKVNDVVLDEMSNNVITKEEQMIGQHFDFKG